MDEAKTPGIAIRAIHLLESHLKVDLDYLAGDEDGPMPHDLQLTAFFRDVSEDGRELNVMGTFDLMHDIEKRPLDLSATFIAQYEVIGGDENMRWSEFSDKMALAHIIPFLREFVSTATARTPYPRLMIAPVNVAVLLRDFRERATESQEAEDTEED